MRRNAAPARSSLALVGFLALTALVSLAAVLGIRSAFVANDRLASAYEDDVVAMAALETVAERESSNGRAYLFAGEESNVQRLAGARTELTARLDELARNAKPSERRLVSHAHEAHADYMAAIDRVIARKRSGAIPDELRRAFDGEARPAKEELSRALLDLSERKHQALTDAQRAASASRGRALVAVIGVALLAMLIATALALRLASALRRQAAQQRDLHELLARVGQSNRDLEAFAGRVAHDVRNVLGPISVASSMLGDPELPDSAVQKATKVIARGIDRAFGLVDALLAFSRASQPVDPHAGASFASVLADALRELEPVAGQVDATIDVASEDVTVRCPPALLHVVLTNVIGNALKFMRDRETRHLTLAVHATRLGGELCVTDTGPGISDDDKQRIFEPFFRAASTNVQGTGIGLATVRRIVEAHGGRIDVTSKLDVGSTFRVWLPRCQDDDLNADACVSAQGLRSTAH